MAGHALFDTVNNALDVVGGDLAPHAAIDIQEQELPVCFVEDNHFGRFAEKS